MGTPVCTKITPEEKEVLKFLAHSRGTTPSKMIRQAILAQYQLDSADLLARARSFFDEGARHVAQNASPANSQAQS